MGYNYTLIIINYCVQLFTVKLAIWANQIASVRFQNFKLLNFLMISLRKSVKKQTWCFSLNVEARDLNTRGATLRHVRIGVREVAEVNAELKCNLLDNLVQILEAVRLFLMIFNENVAIWIHINQINWSICFFLNQPPWRTSCSRQT